MKNSRISVKTRKSPILRKYESFIKLTPGVIVIHIRKAVFRKKASKFYNELQILLIG